LILKWLRISRYEIMQKVSRRKIPWLTVLASTAGAGVVLLFLGGLYLLVLARDLPSFSEIKSRQVDQSTRIYDREGKILLYEVTSGQKRTVVPLSEIPDELEAAIIAIEDQNFYSNPAFDWRGIVRAALVNLQEGRVVQGGSTLTQQVARTAFLSTERIWSRKIKELFLAVKLSRQYSKDEILEFYLNEIPFGPNLSGVAAASEAYFGKPVSELNLAESALMAALPKAPSYYSPWGSHVDELLERQRLVLRKMKETGKISEMEMKEASSRKLVFQPRKQGILAPHFVLAVQDYLIKKYGEDMVRAGGLSVVTTLNMRLQEAAETAVKEGAARNEELYGGKNAALVAEDPKTGQILALVGSRDYNAEGYGSYNVPLQGLRQPGSALKPFVYLTAFEKGFTPDTVLFDAPTEFVPRNENCPIIPDFNNDDPQCFHPQNFDDEFRGPVNLRVALGQSLNVVAVKVLYLAGMRDTVRNLQSFGLETLDDPSRYGLSVVLGGGEVRLIDMVKAYSVLASDGVLREQTMVLEVKDAKGRVLENFSDNGGEQVTEPQYARQVNDILTDIRVRTGLLGANTSLTTFQGHEVALKTGTTEDYRDAWAMGYTPNLAVGVWAGNNDGAPMHRRGSSILAAIPMWNRFLAQIMPEWPPETFARPDPSSTNKPVLAGNYMPQGELHSILYYVDRDDPAGALPGNPSADSQFQNWETSVLTWAAENNMPTPGLAGAPISGQNPAPPSSNIIVRLVAPRQGEFLRAETAVLAEISAPTSLVRVSAYFNGRKINEVSGGLPQNYYFAFSFAPWDAGQQNYLEVEAVDRNGGVNRGGVIVYR